MVEAKDSSAPTGAGEPAPHDDADQIPDHGVREAFTKLRATYGDELNVKLQDPKVAVQFIHDPVGTLREFGWEVPEEIGRLASRARTKPDLRGPSVLLANGQVLRPRFHVTFRTQPKDGQDKGVD